MSKAYKCPICGAANKRRSDGLYSVIGLIWHLVTNHDGIIDEILDVYENWKKQQQSKP
jgi:hypothetical protein